MREFRELEETEHWSAQLDEPELKAAYHSL
jgi:hypothetical protein